MPIKNHQYNSILREYDARRLKSHRETMARREKLYREIPRLKELDDEIAHGSVRSEKLSLAGDATALLSLRQKNEALSAEKKALVAAHGYPADYLEPKYLCADCSDTGFIGREKCHCFRQAIVDLLYSQANVRQAIGRENFDNFSYNYYSDDYIDETVHMTPLENIHCVVAGAKKFIAEFDTAPGNLLIYGNTGVGKTFLTNCIARELIMTGHTVIYLTAFELFDILERRKFSRPDNGEDEEYSEAANQFAHIRDCDLLIIDDLGTELNNAFISSQLYQCINERLLGRRATIISTNLSFEQLKNNYSERIFSRITGSYTFLKIVGEDIRIRKKLSLT